MRREMHGKAFVRACASARVSDVARGARRAWRAELGEALVRRFTAQESA